MCPLNLDWNRMKAEASASSSVIKKHKSLGMWECVYYIALIFSLTHHLYNHIWKNYSKQNNSRQLF